MDDSASKFHRKSFKFKTYLKFGVIKVMKFLCKKQQNSFCKWHLLSKHPTTYFNSWEGGDRLLSYSNHNSLKQIAMLY